MRLGVVARDRRGRGQRHGRRGRCPLPVSGWTGSWRVLLGAVTAPTDAAAVFSVLRRVPLPRRLTGALEAESGLNDAPDGAAGDAGERPARPLDHGVLGFVGDRGLRAGRRRRDRAAVGFGGALGDAAGGAARLGPVPDRGAVRSSWRTAAPPRCTRSRLRRRLRGRAGARQRRLPHRAATRSFAEGVAWLAQIGLFVMLGLLASPGRIAWPSSSRPSLAGLRPDARRPAAVGARLRPAAAGALARAGVPVWAGLRGAVPIVLATIPLAERVAGADEAVRHRLRDGRRSTRCSRPDAAVGRPAAGGDRAAASRATSTSRRRRWSGSPPTCCRSNHPAVSRMHGVEVGELRLPVGASVSLIVRDGRTLVPEPRTVLRHGDELLVVTPRQAARAPPRRGCARCRAAAGSRTGSTSRRRRRGVSRASSRGDPQAALPALRDQRPLRLRRAL